MSSMHSFRRSLLHVPFFKEAPSPAAEDENGFFPIYPENQTTPEIDAGGQQTTFPANITLSNSHTAPAGHNGAKIVTAVLIPVVVIIVFVIAFISYRRRRRTLAGGGIADKVEDCCSDSARLFPYGGRKSSGHAPGYLFFGTLSGSHRNLSYSDSTAEESPELRPLPPLMRQFRQDYSNSAAGIVSSDDEYYSPRDSVPERPTPGRLSSSRRTFPSSIGGEKVVSIDSPILTTPSYPSSPAASSRRFSSFRSLKSRIIQSLTKDIELTSRPPPPPPPPPPPSYRPLTPSPPKRKLPSPSPISSDTERIASNSRLSSSRDYNDNPNSSRIVTEFTRTPPPPPPPPPVGYWESQVRDPRVIQQPVIVATRPIGAVVPPALVPSADLREGDKDVEEESCRPKLKPLHWDKVRASSDRAMVWDQLKSSSFQLNEEMIETLFVSNAVNTTPKEMPSKCQVLPVPAQENKVLDSKKSHNIAILLRALNVSKEEVCDALLEGNYNSLGTELLETLLKMAPTKEEELKLKEYKDNSLSKLGPAEKFLKALVDIPFAFKRVDALLYVANFESEVSYLKKSFETLEAACEELRSSRLFLRLLDAVLKTGNRMNVGTNRGDAHAFKLDTLLKLVDVKGIDGKTTLLHFVVQEITRAEGSRLCGDKLSNNDQPIKLHSDLECKNLGLKVVAGLGSELSNVKKAATMDFGVLSSYVSKLAGGLGKIREVLRLNDSLNSIQNCQKFSDIMEAFMKNAEDGIIKMQAQESVALSLVKEITEYFHGNSANEEPHPFRIFMVVSDFLSVLDRVCKEVGRINDRTVFSSERQFPVPVNPMLATMLPKSLRPRSSDGESSLSS